MNEEVHSKNETVDVNMLTSEHLKIKVATEKLNSRKTEANVPAPTFI